MICNFGTCIGQSSNVISNCIRDKILKVKTFVVFILTGLYYIMITNYIENNLLSVE